MNTLLSPALWQSIVGGILTLIGVGFGSWFTARQAEKRELLAFQRVKHRDELKDLRSLYQDSLVELQNSLRNLKQDRTQKEQISIILVRLSLSSTPEICNAYETIANRIEEEIEMFLQELKNSLQLHSGSGHDLEAYQNQRIEYSDTIQHDRQYLMQLILSHLHKTEGEI